MEGWTTGLGGFWSKSKFLKGYECALNVWCKCEARPPEKHFLVTLNYGLALISHLKKILEISDEVAPHVYFCWWALIKATASTLLKATASQINACHQQSKDRCLWLIRITFLTTKEIAKIKANISAMPAVFYSCSSMTTVHSEAATTLNLEFLKSIKVLLHTLFINFSRQTEFWKRQVKKLKYKFRSRLICLRCRFQ